MTKGVVHNWGLTDISSYKDETRELCPFYAKWTDLVKRVHSRKYIEKHPTYSGCKITESWRKASGFKSWMSDQNWEGLELDKDILFMGNKIYSPDTCVFVPTYVNYVLLGRDSRRGLYPIGVSKRSPDKRCRPGHNPEKYVAAVNDGLGNYIKLGSTFTTPGEAHKAWQAGKADAIIRVVDRYRNEGCYRKDVEEALLGRVDLLSEHLKLGIETKSL